MQIVELTSVIVIIAGGLAWMLFLIAGWQAEMAKRMLLEAIRIYRQGNYERARKSVLFAVRQDSTLKRNANVQAFYEMIVARGRSTPLVEVTRVVREIEALPKGKLERLASDRRLKVALLILIMLAAIIRLLAR